MNKTIGGPSYRRDGARERLEAQLASGNKPDRSSQSAITRYTTGQAYIPLSLKDKERIKKEMDILKSRI
jgi:hypothetical protein